MNIIIRNEKSSEYFMVESLVRDAFWNEFSPGTDNHLLLHKMRFSPDYIEDLSLLAVSGERPVAQIAYTRGFVLTDETQPMVKVLSFGPLAVIPSMQKKGLGGALIEESCRRALEKGERAIIIFGYPEYYQRFGFKPAKSFNISSADGLFPAAMLAKELYPGALKGIEGKFIMSHVFGDLPDDELEAFDALFPEKVKGKQPSQEKFAEICQKFL